MTNYHKYKSYAKINIFLKIHKRDDKFHFLISRFLKIHSLFDELYFTPSNNKEFKILGKNLPCPTTNNLIYKLYQKLLITQYKEKVQEFLSQHNLILHKNIATFAGLGGGSSNVAIFLQMINKELNLKLNIGDMLFLCADIGSDIAFFLYDFDSANVFGKGEIIKEYKEEIPNIKIINTNIKCKTPLIYKEFRENFELSNEEESLRLINQDSKFILENNNNLYLNDLYKPAIKQNNELQEYANNGYFLSGSGSSVFSSS